MQHGDGQIVEEGFTKTLNVVQTALDVAGLEPTIGAFADGTNAVISTLRAAAAKEKDDRKKHLINTGISTLSIIPFADVLKIFKIRKLGAPATKAAIKGIRAGKVAAKGYKNYKDDEPVKKFDSEYKKYLEKYSYEDI